MTKSTAASTPHFDRACAGTQARKAIQTIQREHITHSVGTNRNYQECLKHVAQYIKDEKLGDLRSCTWETAVDFLQARAGEYSQKTLDMHRQAVQAFFQARGDMNKGDRLEIVKSTVETVQEHRAYTAEQVEAIAARQTELNALATEIAYAAGLRAHELLTIRPIAEQPADVRYYRDGTEKNLDTKWLGREPGVPYTVVGKGGLVREVRLPQDLADRLEQHRLDAPETVRDRGINYQSHYGIAGGQKWSRSFSAASTRALGWSTGAHGLRHAYAQERLSEVSAYCGHEKALETVSQELGHFRPDITLAYLR